MGKNLWKNIRSGFRSNKLAAAGMIMIFVLVLCSVLAFLYPVDPDALNISERLLGPSLQHPFGTDEMGRDYFARCLYGGRASMLVGFMAMFLATMV